MSVTAMGLTALLVLFILVIFYSGSLLSLYPVKALQFVGCAGLAVAALLYVIGSRQEPLNFIAKLLLYEGIYLCMCLTAAYMFMHRHFITCYAVPLSGAFMVFLLPAFFGREGQGSQTIPVRISVLIPLSGSCSWSDRSAAGNLLTGSSPWLR